MYCINCGKPFYYGGPTGIPNYCPECGYPQKGTVRPLNPWMGTGMLWPLGLAWGYGACGQADALRDAAGNVAGSDRSGEAPTGPGNGMSFGAAGFSGFDDFGGLSGFDGFSGFGGFDGFGGFGGFDGGGA